MIEKVIDIQIKGNADQAVGSLKSQLREAQAEVATLSDKFGATSQEAINAAKRAGELKDRIGDAKALTDAFNPDAKFKALSASLSGVAGGFAAVQGGMALFGSQSEDVEKTLLKVQSAMALSQGLQSIGESVDSFKQLGAVVKSYAIVQKASTAAQWLWNAAMTANPLGAIVLAITAVIAAGYGLIKFFGTVEISSKKAMIGIQENAKALQDSERITKKHNEALKDSANYQYEMAKASGASAKELQAISIKQANADISLKTLNRTIAQNTYYRELNSLAILKNSGATEEAIKMQDELVKKALENFSSENKALTASVRDKKLIIQKGNVDERQAKTDHFEKLKEDTKTKNEEQRKIDEENIQKNFLKTIPELDDSLVELELSAIDAKNQSKRELDDKYKQDTLDAQKQFELQIAGTIYESESAREEREKEVKERKIKNYRDTTEAVGSIAKSGEDLLAQVQANGIAKGKAGQAAMKALALVQIGADSAIAFSKMMQGTESSAAGAASVAGPAAPAVYLSTKIAFYASGAATILANLARARALLSGGGGGGATAAGGGATGAAPSPPSFNIVGASGTNQIAQAIGGQQAQPVQAYVVAGAVTTGQSLNRNIIANASMG